MVVSISQWRHFSAASIEQEDFKVNREQEDRMITGRQDILLTINRQTMACR